MRQAELAGKALKNRQFSAIISSPLQRAYLTAEAIYNEQAVKPPFTTDERLMEVHMGAFEDKNWNTHKMPKVDGVPYREQRFPGGGESRHDAYLRALAFLTDLFAKYSVMSVPPIHILIVAHGMFLREMSNALHNLNRLPWNDIRWHNTAVTTFQITKGRLELIEQNNTSHLKSLQRQRGGIGSSSHDRHQQTLGQYFGKTA
ncbi:hypothetical protein K450DRAFT_242907 [Umbelopsis ramanniana AG]|uniref:Phosphoglycerate mutase-like protein n=1 Tax=Umbelopsis ramanniana AG TaxID=1314678 RepID=A0AAD5EAK5_UMBRA|nr:uncharacterized protein K450DRAFT_242907 [Umbelopsis ramanniana AG]KAI8579365.1 hypothetical protein K450DRAFT_242907 [Umbelopsis ramanniana AG]